MLDQSWALNDSVAVRPEPFGALVYDFHTRRLTFLKQPALVRVVEALGSSRTVADALDAAGVAEADRERYCAALSRLADQQIISRRSTT